MSRQRVDMLTYFNLYVPALDWIMHGMSIKADDALLNDIFLKCRDKKNKYGFYFITIFNISIQ